jgi:hypothetical protein
LHVVLQYFIIFCITYIFKIFGVISKHIAF